MGALRIVNEDIDKLLEEWHRRDKFDTEFVIEDNDSNEDDSINLDKSKNINRYLEGGVGTESISV